MIGLLYSICALEFTPLSLSTADSPGMFVLADPSALPLHLEFVAAQDEDINWRP